MYVGRTKNLQQRFLQHSHLTKEVAKIEYIECQTEADMVWREIYYINLYYNMLSSNISNVYDNGKITTINLKDKWREYKIIQSQRTLEDDLLVKNHTNYVHNLPTYNYTTLIHIIENEKLNKIGKSKYSLSREWYKKHQNDIQIKLLKNNVTNFFRNMTTDTHSINNLWTTYPEFRLLIKSKGYTKGYVAPNEIDSDLYIHKHNLAYLSNIFYPPNIGNIGVDEDGYALSEMLQFIWRSAIRDGNEIWVYIPSIRMRTLLRQWIINNSNQKMEENH